MASNLSITDLAAEMRQASIAAKAVIDDLRRGQPDGNWFEYQMAVEDTVRAGFDAVGNAIRQIERLTALAKSQQPPNAIELTGSPLAASPATGGSDVE